MWMRWNFLCSCSWMLGWCLCSWNASAQCMINTRVLQVASFYRWRRGNHPMEYAWFPVNAPNWRIGTLHLDQTPWTAFGTSVRGSPLKMGLCWADWWCGRTLARPKRSHLRWVASCGLLVLAHGGLVQSWVDLIWLWAYSPHDWGLILRANGPSPLGSCRVCVLLYSLCTLSTFSMLFRHVLL